MYHLLPLSLMFLIACPTGTSDPNTDDTSDTSDTGEEDLCPVVDCANPDCAEEFECTWPITVSQAIESTFTGRQIGCLTGGVFPVDVDDCVSNSTSEMDELTTASPCSDCDKVYAGPVTYSVDTCSELLGETAPAEASFGIKFVSPTEREMWAPIEGVWVKTATVTGTDGLFVYETTEAIRIDPPDCNNGEQHVGDLLVKVTFTDK